MGKRLRWFIEQCVVTVSESERRWENKIPSQIAMIINKLHPILLLLLLVVMLAVPQIKYNTINNSKVLISYPLLKDTSRFSLASHTSFYSYII